MPNFFISNLISLLIASSSPDFLNEKICCGLGRRGAGVGLKNVSFDLFYVKIVRKFPENFSKAAGGLKNFLQISRKFSSLQAKLGK